MRIGVNDLFILRDNMMIIQDTEIHDMKIQDMEIQDMEIQESLMKCL